MKYEENKTYTMTVLFADAKGRYPNVQSAPPDKEVFKIDIAGKLARPPKSLSGKHIDVVCIGEAVDVPPNFMLAEKYFAAVPPAPKVGKCLGIDEGLRVEFKKTIIYSSATSQPGADKLLGSKRVRANSYTSIDTHLHAYGMLSTMRKARRSATRRRGAATRSCTAARTTGT